MDTDTICACGCGEPIEPKKHHKSRGIPKFRPGHHSRTKAMREVRAKERLDIPPPNPSGLCMCGCGEKTAIAKVSRSERGVVIGEHVCFLPGHINRMQGRGPDHHNWKGGRIMRRGYVLLHAPDNPHSDSKGYVPEHQVVACEARGSWLEPGEEVHHINGIKDDNRAENLVILTRAQHRAAHDMAAFGAKGNAAKKRKAKAT